MRNLDDVQLLERVLGHDDAAWCELLRRFRAPIFRCIQRAIGTSEADDAFGEWCIHVLANDMKRLRAWDSTRMRLCSWLCMLAIKAAYDHGRHVRRGGRHWSPPSNEFDPLAGLIEREDREQIAKLITAGTDRDRQLFDLLAADADTDKIVEAMGITPSGIYSKKNKLIARLRARLAA